MFGYWNILLFLVMLAYSYSTQFFKLCDDILTGLENLINMWYSVLQRKYQRISKIGIYTLFQACVGWAFLVYVQPYTRYGEELK